MKCGLTAVQWAALSQWKVDDGINQFFWHHALGNQTKIMNALADVHACLMGVYHTCECDGCTLSASRLGKQIVIACEDAAAEQACPVKQFRIRHSCATVFLCGDDIDSGRNQGAGNGAWNVNVHVE
jgi:hypothetical protein